MFVCQLKESGLYTKFNRSSGRYASVSEIGQATVFNNIAELLEQFTLRGHAFGYRRPFNRDYVDFQLVIVEEVPTPRIQRTGQVIN